MPARARTGALRSRRAGLAKFPLGVRVGCSALQFVRHLAQLAGDAEIEAGLRQAAAALCQLGEKFGVGHIRAIANPAAGKIPRRRNVPNAPASSVQPRLDRFKHRGFVARFEPFRSFQPRAGGFNEGLLMRGVVRRRPAEALQRELAAYANMLHRAGPHLVYVGRACGWEGSTIRAAVASSSWRSTQAKENPAAAGFSLDCPVAWRAKDGIHLRWTGASVQPQGLVAGTVSHRVL